MRTNEERSGIGGPRRTRRKSAAALDRLRSVAERGDADAEFVVALLEAAAQTAEQRRIPAALPTAERDVWASVGARFEQSGGSANGQEATDRFGELIAHSVFGDDALAEQLGVTPSRISQRVADRSLYAFAVGDKRFFPMWQFTDDGPLPGLKVVLSVLDPALHPLSVAHWFTTANVDLLSAQASVSPVVWLATGGSPDTAAALAADL